MLDTEDIKKLTEYQLEVFKDVFLTKEDGKVLEEKIDHVQTSVDALAKTVKDHTEELTVVNKRMKNVEDWVDEASPKLGIKLEH